MAEHSATEDRLMPSADEIWIVDMSTGFGGVTTRVLATASIENRESPSSPSRKSRCPSPRACARRVLLARSTNAMSSKPASQVAMQAARSPSQAATASHTSGQKPASWAGASPRGPERQT